MHMFLYFVMDVQPESYWKYQNSLSPAIAKHGAGSGKS
jgi:hypothetical protein